MATHASRIRQLQQHARDSLEVFVFRCRHPLGARPKVGAAGEHNHGVFSQSFLPSGFGLRRRHSKVTKLHHAADTARRALRPSSGIPILTTHYSRDNMPRSEEIGKPHQTPKHGDPAESVL